jgi:hypothetical protein
MQLFFFKTTLFTLIKMPHFFMLQSDRVYSVLTYILIQFQFVRKVYATLLSQLLITIGFIAVFVFVKPIKEFYCDGVVVDENGLGHCVARSNNGFIMYIVSYVIFFITYIAIACCESVRRKSPANMIAMAIFTLSLSVWVRFFKTFHTCF